VLKYIYERNAASLSVKTTTNNSITVSLTDNLADSIFNYPLSIRRELPTGWTTAVVTQKGKDVKDTIVTVNSKKHLMFEAVPDGGDIVISQTYTAVKEQVRLYTTGKMVLVDNLKLSINSHQFSGANITVSLFDLKGKVIARHTLNNSESSITLPSERINKSAFFIKSYRWQQDLYRKVFATDVSNATVVNLKVIGIIGRGYAKRAPFFI
jgi:hypothetical protein